VADLEHQGMGFRSLHENIDTTTSTGRLRFHIFAALAEFERELLVDRTKAGLAAAKERGVKAGRKPSLSPEQVDVVRTLHQAGKHTVSEIATIMGVSRATVYRSLQPIDDEAGTPFSEALTQRSHQATPRGACLRWGNAVEADCVRGCLQEPAHCS
jgi:DNA invertase Pin-like site-specific DNA recombinase